MKLNKKIARVEREVEEFIDNNYLTTTEEFEEFMLLLSTSIREIVKESFKEVGLEENFDRKHYTRDSAIKELKKKKGEFLGDG